MQEDIVDFEDFDYGDLDDINPDDLDIENLERELGLLNEDKKKKNENKEASIDASGKNELEQKDTNVSIEQDKSSHVTSSTDSKKPESMPEKSSTSSTSASASINASTTTATKATPVKQQYQQRQQRSFNNNRPPYNNNNQMRGGFGGQYRPPNTSFPHQQYPFAQQGMMGMKYVFHPINKQRFLFSFLSFLPLFISPLTLSIHSYPSLTRSKPFPLISLPSFHPFFYYQLCSEKKLSKKIYAEKKRQKNKNGNITKRKKKRNTSKKKEKKTKSTK
ncbi:hypothetical protein BDA99DRAFT_324258 [Phascolomyces articulosus]|uniref:Uncharacterized protein n=1 Tax=Phascolomyces articulosus TaxID=60185 RepID=A0AAD5PIB3_9FUNG|nr:hypothetical protein BDA99DRAFT_324258 [Phascolomyces articulosus]